MIFKKFIPAVILVFLGSLTLTGSSVCVEDVPDDDGTALIISWEPPGDIPGFFMYKIYRKDSPDGEFIQVGKSSKIENCVFVDRDPRYPLNAGMNVVYRIVANDEEGNEIKEIGVSEVFSSSHSFFNGSKINTFIAVTFVFTTLISFLTLAKKDKKLFIRKIAGLDALDEAVGRATEMGRPVLYVPGLSTMDDIATVASINILGPVAKKVAEYETKILVPNRNPIVYTITHEVVKEAYLEAGRPDAFQEDQVFFVSESQFAYVAAVNGIMMREKPATNLFLGMFWAESLLLAETGNATGAVQIAGTDSVTQLPFFVTSCDYTLIGEELYAASAYLSRDPVLVGTIKAQDIEKAIILILLVLLSILAIMNFNLIRSDNFSRLIMSFFGT
ncbi:fibronectin type III domain-containing protein [candidate division WOR-3 bacterium]|nr:fibronectin type III domain-containing protein [candidate division WOR-3 bacterium]